MVGGGGGGGRGLNRYREGELLPMVLYLDRLIINDFGNLKLDVADSLDFGGVMVRFKLPI